MPLNQNEILQALLDGLDPSEPISVLKNALQQIQNPESKKLLELGILIGKNSASTAPSNLGFTPPQTLEVIILLHGIRTHAVWHELVLREFQQHPHLRVYPVGYEFLPLPQFWFPWYWRHKPQVDVLEEIREILSKHRDANISVLAHSFGTYILTNILKENSDIVFHKVLLCGSIVNAKFKWNRLPNFPTKGILNDVGTKDLLPAIAKMTSWGYGSSGTFGFGSGKVKNRFHELEHSGFFTESHIRKFWLPYFLSGEIVESDWGYKRPIPPWRVSLINFLPLKLIVLGGLIGGIYWFA